MQQLHIFQRVQMCLNPNNTSVIIITILRFIFEAKMPDLAHIKFAGGEHLSRSSRLHQITSVTDEMIKEPIKVKGIPTRCQDFQQLHHQLNELHLVKKISQPNQSPKLV